MKLGQVDKAERIRRIHDEHAAVLDMTRRIQARLAALREGPEATPEARGEAKNGRELPELVRELHLHLQRHFRLEETGGLLGDAVRAPDPGSARKVEELVAEHRAFERRLVRILAELDGGIPPPRTVRECFERELSGFFEDLARHERDENDLLQALVVRDLGAGD